MWKILQCLIWLWRGFCVIVKISFFFLFFFFWFNEVLLPINDVICHSFPLFLYSWNGNRFCKFWFLLVVKVDLRYLLFPWRSFLLLLAQLGKRIYLTLFWKHLPAKMMILHMHFWKQIVKMSPVRSCWVCGTGEPATSPHSVVQFSSFCH